MILPLHIALHLTVALRHIVAILHRYKELLVVDLLVSVRVDVGDDFVRFCFFKRFSPELTVYVIWWGGVVVAANSNSKLCV